MKRTISVFIIILMLISLVGCGLNEKQEYDANEVEIIESFDNMIEDARQEMVSNQEQLNEILSMIDETDSDTEARQIAAKYNPRGYSAEMFANMDRTEVYDFIKSQIDVESQTFQEMQTMLENSKQENLETYRNGTLIVD